MKIIILYDGNEESALRCDIEEYLRNRNINVEAGDVGYYTDA